MLHVLHFKAVHIFHKTSIFLKLIRLRKANVVLHTLKAREEIPFLFVFCFLPNSPSASNSSWLSVTLKEWLDFLKALLKGISLIMLYEVPIDTLAGAFKGRGVTSASSSR